MLPNNDVLGAVARAKAEQIQAIARAESQLEEAGIRRRRPLKQVAGWLYSVARSIVNRMRAPGRITEAPPVREPRRAEQI